MNEGKRRQMASTRPYHSQLREGQARETRRRIVEAGHDLFVEQGYAATTIDAIAARGFAPRAPRRDCRTPLTIDVGLTSPPSDGI